MKIKVEFYRTRSEDDAHAIVGRETEEATYLEDVIRIARALPLSLSMPQRPDPRTITDADGNNPYSVRFDMPNHPNKGLDSKQTTHRTRPLRRGAIGDQFGRRIGTDRSWTVYHVFTGIPARIGGCPSTGLNRSDATKHMMSLNIRYERRRLSWRLMGFGGNPGDIDGVRP
ncbi:hypothetical protein [Arvimicrobium flavum]|uniref:hypothetical protein n=1 Tax=Arvimicrobium flavum TaxID=3393320 RepID=UPI0030842751